VPLASSAAGRELAKHLKGDLDTILAKALKKSVHERYSSTEAFANDLVRYLEGQPVLAQKDSQMYRAVKFLRRNAIEVSLASAASVAIMGAAGFAFWQASVAKLEANRATSAKKFALSIFNDVTPFAGAGGVVSAADLLNAAGPKLLTSFSDDPCGRAELALSIAAGIERFGRPENVEQPARIAEEAALGCDVNPLLVWEARYLLSESFLQRDHVKSLELVTSIIDNVPVSDAATALLVVSALDNQSFLVAKKDDKATAIQALLRAREIAEQYLGKDHDKTIRIVGFLANTYRRFGDSADELKFARESYELAHAKYDRQRPSRSLINAERWYGEALLSHDRPQDSIEYLRRVLTDQQTIDEKPTIRLANAKFSLGRALRQAGRPVEAIPLLSEALDLEYQLRPNVNDDKVTFAITLSNAYLDLGNVEAARVVLDGLASRISSESSLPKKSALIPWALARARHHALSGDSAAASAELIAVEDAKTGASLWQRAQVKVLRLQLNRLSSDLASLAENIGHYASEDLLSQMTTKGARFFAEAEYALAYIELDRHEEARVSAEACVALLKTAQLEVSSIRATPCMIAQARIALHDDNPNKALDWLGPVFSTWQATQLQNANYFEVMYWFAQATLRSGNTIVGKPMLDSARKGLRSARIPALVKLSRQR
jgi:Tetratricopeptide repeat